MSIGNNTRRFILSSCCFLVLAGQWLLSGGDVWAWLPRKTLLYGIGERPFPSLLTFDYPLARAQAWLNAVEQAEAKLPGDINVRLRQLGLPLQAARSAVAALIHPLDVVTPEHGADGQVRVFLKDGTAPNLDSILTNPWRLLLEMCILWETRDAVTAMFTHWPKTVASAAKSITQLENYAASLRQLWTLAQINAAANGRASEDLPNADAASPNVSLLLMQALAHPDAPDSVAFAERAIELCLQREVSDAAASLWSMMAAGGNYLRARGHERQGQPALAEADLDTALVRMRSSGMMPAIEAETVLARAELRRKRGNIAGMCEDFYSACSLGICQSLAQARRMGSCLP